jgi:cobaltochelatase CobT
MRNLMILAKWLAGRADIDVCEYVGETACIGLVKGRRVVFIPKQWSYSDDPRAAELLEGVIDHEALGHGRFTDLEARKRAEEGGRIKFNNLSGGIQNILEDVYIENRAIAAYPGVKHNLSTMVEILVGRGFFGQPSSFEFAPASALLMAGLLNTLRARLVPGQEPALKGNVDALEPILRRNLGKLWGDVLDVAMEVQNSKTTDDNIALTIRIMQLIEQAATEQPESDQGAQVTQKSKSDDEQEAAESAGNCGADGSPDESIDQTARTEGDKSTDDGELAEAGKPAKSDSTGDDDGDVIPTNRSVQESQAAQEIIAQKDDEMPITEVTEGASISIGDKATPAPMADLAKIDGRCDMPLDVKRIASMVKSSADDLQDALLSETRCDKTTKLVGKSLNNRVLSRVKLGNGRVFRQKQEGKAISTAVQFVVDMSGSMRDALSNKVTRHDAAFGLIYGMGDLLDEYEVPFQVIAYSDAYADVKKFEEEWSRVRRRYALPALSGGTFTGIAVQKSLGELVVRPEERKLLIVITDGDTSDLPVLISCYAEAREMGIEIASVMIGPPIRSISQLAQAFGFPATNINTTNGLGRFAVERVLEAI